MKVYSVSKKSLSFKNSMHFLSFFHKKSVPFKISMYFPSFFHKKSVPFKISTYYPSFFHKNSVPFKNPRITLEYQVCWIISLFIFDIFLYIIDCIFRSVGLPLLGLLNKLPVSSNLLLQALIMQCSGGSILYCTRSLSLASFMACLVWSLAMKSEAA